MLRISRIHSCALEAGRERVRQVQDIFRASFPDVASYADKIPALLDTPFKFGYHTMLLVAEQSSGKVTGFSLFQHLPEINSALLDFMAVAPGVKGGGLGSALYEATREYCQASGARGLYMEVLPDDPEIVHDPARLEVNRKRLAFYEHYGVRPIIGTAYETPIDDSPAPHLLFDGLGREAPLRRAEARAAVRVILTCKYAHLVGPDYVERVAKSFVDDPVQFRPPRYVRAADQPRPVSAGRMPPPFVLVSDDRHVVHHVRDRGYVERPARVAILRDTLMPTGLFSAVTPRAAGEKAIRAVHDNDFVTYLRVVCEKLSSERPVYPYVFPVRRPERKPKELAVRAGYYCIDTFTPLDHNAYAAARGAVDVAVTAAQEVLAGCHMAYALCRPPGHHAERRVFGGFCYFNNAAVAANLLSAHGRVAVLDIDFHHGNGTQDIFYQRNDVLTVSLHGHPNGAYPYFSGFADERGDADGEGFNLNIPLPDGTDAERYLAALTRALTRIVKHRPLFLVVSLGFDTLRGDPTGGFTLTPSVLHEVGARLAGLKLPMLVCQEGGYNLRNLRRGAPAFFNGVAQVLK
jgi:acetoin utilization deacetylase AcuC-like enzyme/GNAT superfamily N-acetyltransferase